MGLGDGGGFVEVLDLQHDVAADGLVGLGEGTVGHALAAGTGDDATGQFEGAAVEGFTLVAQADEPGVPAFDELLAFLGTEVGVVFRAGVAEEKQVGLGHGQEGLKVGRWGSRCLYSQRSRRSRPDIFRKIVQPCPDTPIPDVEFLNPSKPTMSDATPTYVVPAAASPEHEILSCRTVPFPRAKVFAAWIHPELHARWWGPAGFTNTFYNYDVRPGGAWRFTMHGPDGRDYENVSRFEHVAERECLVFKHVVAPVFTAVIHFTDDGDGTRIEWHMIFEDVQTCAAIREYVGDKNTENFERLEALLRDTPDDALEWRELVVLREMPVARAVVWRTMITRTAEWWCPKPWTTPLVDWDLRPGGRCHTIMAGPAGEQVDLVGTFLEVAENERLVFTDALQPGWRPTMQPFMIGVFELRDNGQGGTTYRACARHWTAEAGAQHIDMGFRSGWGAVADQLIAVSQDEAARS